MLKECPFKLPVRIESGGYLVASGSELICRLESATPDETAYLVQCINAHEPLVRVAEELVKWEQDPDRYGGDLADIARMAFDTIFSGLLMAPKSP